MPPGRVPDRENAALAKVALFFVELFAGGRLGEDGEVLKALDALQDFEQHVHGAVGAQAAAQEQQGAASEEAP